MFMILVFASEILKLCTLGFFFAPRKSLPCVACGIAGFYTLGLCLLCPGSHICCGHYFGLHRDVDLYWFVCFLGRCMRDEPVVGEAHFSGIAESEQLTVVAAGESGGIIKSFLDPFIELRTQVCHSLFFKTLGSF